HAATACAATGRSRRPAAPPQVGPSCCCGGTGDCPPRTAPPLPADRPAVGTRCAMQSTGRRASDAAAPRAPAVPSRQCRLSRQPPAGIREAVLKPVIDLCEHVLNRRKRFGGLRLESLDDPLVT